MFYQRTLFLTQHVGVYGITIIGAGALGSLFSSTIIALQASVEIKDIAVVTGLGNFSRILGGALGVAISSAVLNSHLNQELPQLIPTDEAYRVIQSSEYVNHGLPEAYKDITIEVYVKGLQMIWYVLIAMAGLGFIASFFVKHHSVRRHVKAKAAADAAAAAAATEKEQQEKTEDESVKIDVPVEKEENIDEQDLSTKQESSAKQQV